MNVWNSPPCAWEYCQFPMRDTILSRWDGRPSAKSPGARLPPHKAPCWGGSNGVPCCRTTLGTGSWHCTYEGSGVVEYSSRWLDMDCCSNSLALDILCISGYIFELTLQKYISHQKERYHTAKHFGRVAVVRIIIWGCIIHLRLEITI